MRTLQPKSRKKHVTDDKSRKGMENMKPSARLPALKMRSEKAPI
jgi:hypothetical protein